jgi:hypothetical protein
MRESAQGGDPQNVATGVMAPGAAAEFVPAGAALTQPSCTPSDSRGAGMLRKDIFPRLTRVAGFPTLSERLLRPYATRAQAGHERSCCPRPARFTGADV